MTQPDQNLLDDEQTEALTAAFTDIANEHSAEDALIYLALASPPAVKRPYMTICSEIRRLREDELLREDRSARVSAQHRLQERITSDLKDRL